MVVVVVVLKREPCGERKPRTTRVTVLRASCRHHSHAPHAGITPTHPRCGCVGAKETFVCVCVCECARKCRSLRASLVPRVRFFMGARKIAGMMRAGACGWGVSVREWVGVGVGERVGVGEWAGECGVCECVWMGVCAHVSVLEHPSKRAGVCGSMGMWVGAQVRGGGPYARRRAVTPRRVQYRSRLPVEPRNRTPRGQHESNRVQHHYATVPSFLAYQSRTRRQRRSSTVPASAGHREQRGA